MLVMKMRNPVTPTHGKEPDFIDTSPAKNIPSKPAAATASRQTRDAAGVVLNWLISGS